MGGPRQYRGAKLQWWLTVRVKIVTFQPKAVWQITVTETRRRMGGKSKKTERSSRNAKIENRDQIERSKYEQSRFPWTSGMKDMNFCVTDKFHSTNTNQTTIFFTTAWWWNGWNAYRCSTQRSRSSSWTKSNSSRTIVLPPESLKELISQLFPRFLRTCRPETLPFLMWCHPQDSILVWSEVQNMLLTKKLKPGDLRACKCACIFSPVAPTSQDGRLI